jgi:hypothetical protein
MASGYWMYCFMESAIMCLDRDMLNRRNGFTLNPDAIMHVARISADPAHLKTQPLCHASIDRAVVCAILTG